MAAIIMQYRKCLYYVPGCLHRISSISQAPIPGETIGKKQDRAPVWISSQAKPRHFLFNKKYLTARDSGSGMQTWQYG